jgi:hypothetical protein
VTQRSPLAGPPPEPLRLIGGLPRPPRRAGDEHQDPFSFRIDVWDDQGNSIVQHVADDFETAVAPYWAACRRWPKAKITLRQGARIVHRSWREC